ncbi:ATP-binding cassette domain-containing protein [Avibacterium sp. 21-599]|nr:ATP-binding cassette domain-containing protein [Avibacterium sp. 21-599]MCW9717135.1 ATP-binding cassette domain-containing protein [Avibacterium sp. 21-599]MCW9718452.1 ATP-binding cassette domain-containing protein [Avibacterium sp. 21-599]
MIISTERLNTLAERCLLPFDEALAQQAYAIGLPLSNADIDFALNTMTSPNQKGQGNPVAMSVATAEHLAGTGKMSSSTPTTPSSPTAPTPSLHQRRAAALQALLLDEQLDLTHHPLASEEKKQWASLSAPCVVTVNAEQALVVLAKNPNTSHARQPIARVKTTRSGKKGSEQTLLLYARHSDPIELTIAEWHALLHTLTQAPQKKANTHANANVPPHLNTTGQALANDNGQTKAQAHLSHNAKENRNADANADVTPHLNTTGQALANDNGQTNAQAHVSHNAKENRNADDTRPHYYQLRKTLSRIQQENAVEQENGHWFWRLFRAEKGIFYRVLIASLFANLLSAISSFFSLQVYDRVIPNKSEETLWALLMGVSIAFLLEGLLRIFRSHLLDYSGKRIDVQATALLLRRLMGLRLSHQTPSPNRLNQQMREFNSVREFFTEAAVGSFVDIPFAVIFLAVIYLLGGPVVFVPLFALLLMVLPALLYRKKMLRIVKSYLGSHAAANRLYNEVSYHLETVKNANAGRFFEQQWNDISYLVATVSMQQRHLVTFLTQWAASIQQFAYAMTITVAAYQVFEGHFTMGAMIALSILTSRALAPFARLSSLLIRWQQIKSSLADLDTIANGEQDDPIEQRKLRRTQLSGHIHLKHLQFSYEAKARPALNIQQLVIRPGEKIGILGPNGSGKSTLLKLLAGLYLPQQGELKFDGIDGRQIAAKDLRRAIAYNTQEAQLFNGTLRDNLTFGDRRIRDEQLLAVLQQTGLAELIQSHPYGLDLPIRDGGAGLSVGQKHSVQLARVFLSQANVVLLDEPTASFDPQVEQHVIHHIQRFTRDKTFIVVTHRTPILSMVDRIIVMAQGQIIADGPRDVILQKIEQAQAAQSA